MKAGFSEIDITPEYYPIRTYMGEAGTALDPICAHAAVFGDGENFAALLSLDVVMVEWEEAQQIREQASKSTGIPVEAVMVCATHNHACPAVIERGSFAREESYIKELVIKGVKALVEAFGKMEDVETGTGSGFEGRISFNRRFVMRDGTAISQPGKSTLGKLLANEGVIDPGVEVLSARNRAGEISGILVNFACHPTHHMGSISAGYPGVLYRNLKERFGEKCVCLFLNGPCGDVIHRNYADPGEELTMEKCGRLLSDTVTGVMEAMDFRGGAGSVAADERKIKLQYRDYGLLEQQEEHPGKLVNVFQSLVDEGWYAWSMERLRRLHSEGKSAEAVLQALKIGDTIIATVPGEYFAEFGLKIKEACAGMNVMIATLANGWFGYIPTREAFTRQGGHETTTAWWSKMAPGSGDIIARNLIQMIRQYRQD